VVIMSPHACNCEIRCVSSRIISKESTSALDETMESFKDAKAEAEGFHTTTNIRF
jgi:hypothetical protein